MMSCLVAAVLLMAQIVGSEFTYKVRNGDSLASIGARYGIDAHVIVESNSLKKKRLVAGQSLLLDNRHITPESTGVQIVINLPQRTLFYFGPDGTVLHYPIAAGGPDWRTPVREFQIVSLEVDPAWDVPASIQLEMREQRKKVVTRVPPGPANPLGKRWIGLSLRNIGIHGTNRPSSIYGLRTHGCIRMHNDDVRELFSQISVGTRGRIVYQTTLMAESGDSIFLEVHPDPYRIATGSLQYAQQYALEKGFFDRLNWDLVGDVIRKQDGIAREVTLR
jgi:L,D-transpeptidase ErfK/SrfK